MHARMQAHGGELALGLARLLILPAIARCADSPTAKGQGVEQPPWQRLLTGADAKHAEGQGVR